MSLIQTSGKPDVDGVITSFCVSAPPPANISSNDLPLFNPNHQFIRSLISSQKQKKSNARVTFLD